MKIISCVRTKNEHLNIGRFCQSYQWADEIVIADGGSEDDTLDIARAFDNTRIYIFPEKIWSNDKTVWGNPTTRHINFLIDRAKEHEADWIIFDDCDCVPNMYIKRDGRTLLENCQESVVMVNRIYVYGKDKYFDGMTRPDGTFTPSLWAWKVGADVQATGEKEWDFGMSINGTIKNLWPPYALLHYFYPSDEYMQQKLSFYRHGIPDIVDPKDYGGPILPLPEWGIE